jgi:ubiquinone/menaquinone biosynthesis C-methylase UbiE
MSSSGGEYIHGTDPDERRRLSLLNNLMNEASLKAMRLEGGERILDVGSGLGQLSGAMARIVGEDGLVVGIERDETQLAEARRNAVDSGADFIEFRQGDAIGLPLDENEWGTYDIVHARFLLEHLPNPQAVVDTMFRAVRPGGRIILEDDDHDVLRLWPEPEGVHAVWRAYIESFDSLGNDPYIGRKLVSLLHTAGARPVANNWNFFGSCAGNETFAGFADNFLGVVDGARETILGSTSLEEAQFDAAIAAFREWRLRSDAAIWYCTFWAEGRRPRGSAE